MGQAAIYSLTSFFMDGHQRRWLRNLRVQLTPGWQVSLEVCPHWITWPQSEEGTKSLLLGQTLGISSSLKLFSPPLPLPIEQLPQNMCQGEWWKVYREWCLAQTTRRVCPVWILGAWLIREGGVKACKKQCPQSLSGVQPLSSFYVFQVFLISPDQEWLRCSP